MSNKEFDFQEHGIFAMDPKVYEIIREKLSIEQEEQFSDRELYLVDKQNTMRERFAASWKIVSSSPRRIKRAVTSTSFKKLANVALAAAIAAIIVAIMGYAVLLIATAFSMIYTPLGSIYLVLCIISAISWIYAMFTFQNSMNEVTLPFHAMNDNLITYNITKNKESFSS